MAFSRGTPLVASLERIVQLTGVQDLKNLETSGELALDDLLVTASDAIHDRLVADGIATEQLTNAEVYERAVAFQFLAILAAGGYLGRDEESESVTERYLGLADRFYTQVRPRLQDAAPRRAGGGLPAVFNVPPGYSWEQGRWWPWS
jgi:hypothetical protein